MAEGRPRLKILAGAPAADRLDWHGERLLSEFLPAFERFGCSTPVIELPKKDISKESFSLSATNHPRWQEIKLAPVDTQLVQKLQARAKKERPIESFRSESKEATVHDNVSFLSVDTVDDNDIDERTNDFLEESFAAYNTTQLISQSEHVLEDDTVLSQITQESSFMSSVSSEATSSLALQSAMSHVVLPSQIANLKALHKADHLTRIQPQTVTVNLVVGIIRVASPRTVFLHRSNRTMDIVELTVGDETRTGFGISFWLLPRDSQRPRHDSMRSALEALRTRDVVLIQNVALHVWQGVVYGQSLSKRISRNETTINLLGHDGQVDTQITNEAQSRLLACSPQMAKVQRVADWVSSFLPANDPANEQKGSFTVAKGKKKFGESQQIQLPPETQ